MAPKNWLVLRAYYFSDYTLSSLSVEVFGSASVWLMNHSFVTHKLGSYQNVAKRLFTAIEVQSCVSCPFAASCGMEF